jgi:hypothetical protein
MRDRGSVSGVAKQDAMAIEWQPIVPDRRLTAAVTMPA